MTTELTFSIENIENKMLSLPQAECPVFHKFDKGYYIRELHMAAGTMAIGHHQNFEHINVFLKGKVLMHNDDGTSTLLTAPMTFIGKPGRKVGYILEDVVWQNVYPTDETDVELLEAFLLTKSETFLAHAAHQFALETTKRESDRLDYAKVIEELGLTESQVQEQVQNTDDQIDIQLYRCDIQLSPIHGRGVFATANIKAGELIGPSRFGFFRTPLGRYTNHSANPNAEMKFEGDDVYLVALEDIIGAVGGLQGQEITVDYRTVRKQLGER